MPDFTPQPNEYVKAIGTHLLALVQQLDASNEKIHSHSHNNNPHNMQNNNKNKKESSEYDDPFLDELEKEQQIQNNNSNSNDNNNDNDMQQQKEGELYNDNMHRNKSMSHEMMEDEIDSEKWLNLIVSETVEKLFSELYQLSELSLKGKINPFCFFVSMCVCVLFIFLCVCNQKNMAYFLYSF